jgi:hypothetical protein
MDFKLDLGEKGGQEEADGWRESRDLNYLDILKLDGQAST